jgi:hypothetical protein
MNLGICQLLDYLGLGNEFDNAMVKICNARDLKQGTEAEQFIFDELDSLKEYVNAQKKDDQTMPGLKQAIIAWIARQS